jgi:hypothetical protein
MLRSISKKKIITVVLLPLLITFLSSACQQRPDSSNRQRLSNGCSYPDYDAKAGFPLAYRYGQDGFNTSSPVGPVSALEPFMSMADVPGCDWMDVEALVFDVAFYMVLVIFVTTISEKRRLQK